jgi:hypothetical protein
MARPRKGKTYAVIAAEGHRESRQAELDRFVLESVEPRAEIITDGWQGYDNLPQLGYYHTQVVSGGRSREGG